ncbi:hypothetical protein Srufu_014950 [Streptomyces libani subsp. rufus]|nr:hypothetical protein Srufu_014950 [Streptomyces libani subsp. rufus]
MQLQGEAGADQGEGPSEEEAESGVGRSVGVDGVQGLVDGGAEGVEGLRATGLDGAEQTVGVRGEAFQLVEVRGERRAGQCAPGDCALVVGGQGDA